VNADLAPRDASEAEWEAFGMESLGELAWQTLPGKQIAPGSGERESWSERHPLHHAAEV
jgi:type I restriction enzyme R subunit